jgi:hypothetical protein
MKEATEITPLKYEEAKPKPQSTRITLEFKNHADVLKEIRTKAETDERDVSNWLRRRIVSIHKEGKL